jgi:hypothetical protein
MTESHIMGVIASALQFLVAAHALWLNRRYGTNRVGWSLFGAFSLLALLQLVQVCPSFDVWADTGVKINATYVLVSFLMLIGMVHLESMLRERLRREKAELKLRAELESEVKSKTAHLTRAIEELMKEMEETKRMSVIIETSHWTKINKTAEALATPAEPPSPLSVLVANDRESLEVFAGAVGAELAAFF